MLTNRQPEASSGFNRKVHLRGRDVVYFLINILLSVLFVVISLRVYDTVKDRIKEDVAGSDDIKLIVSIKMPPQNMIQLFYDDGNEGYTYNEQDSILFESKDSDGFIEYEFKFPVKSIRRFRIDPGHKPGDVYIKYIKLVSENNEHIWYPKDILEQFIPLNHIGDFSVQEQVFYIKVDGSDPFFEINMDTTELFDAVSKPPEAKKLEKANELSTVRVIAMVILFVLCLSALQLTGLVALLHSKFSINKAAGFLLAMVFLAVLWLPLAGAVLGFAPKADNYEKRAMSEKPALKLDKSIIRFAQNYEKYFNDSFAFREQLIKWNTTIRFNHFRISPIPDRVITGKNDWLFYTGENVIQDYKCTQPFSQEELEKIRINLETRRGLLREQGSEFLVFVAPNKHTIYSENLPDSVRKSGKMSRLDQVLEYLSENSDLQIVDLRDRLLKAKESIRVYHKTDTHWNDAGAFTGYVEVIRQLSKNFPELKPMEMSEFDIIREMGDGGDLAQMLSMNKYIREEWIRLVPRKPLVSVPMEFTGQAGDGSVNLRLMGTGDKELPRAVMFRDSFAEAMIPFLSEHFSRILYAWTHNFDFEIIRQERPDVVIHEMVERYLHVLLN